MKSNLSPLAIETCRDFINGFMELHRLNPREARVSLISAFVSAYSILDDNDRSGAAVCLAKMVSKIGSERFEDHADFVAFINEVDF